VTCLAKANDSAAPQLARGMMLSPDAADYFRGE